MSFDRFTPQSRSDFSVRNMTAAGKFAFFEQERQARLDAIRREAEEQAELDALRCETPQTMRTFMARLHDKTHPDNANGARCNG